VLALVAALAGCVQPGRPPVADRSPVFGTRPDSYLVEPGDTLYSIAWRFGLDHRALARANGIGPPYTIYVGQRVRLTEQGGRSRTGLTTTRPRPQPPDPPAEPALPAAPGLWRPPTEAPVARGYGSGNKGLDYRLEPAHAVRAAAAGEVVYAGSGLGGFRHLVIVKHDPAYLSAYSMDRPLAVREGQRVKAGAVLADTDTRGRRPVTLHFEIRRDGEPVDPRSLIGPR
jgi:lipoprotein NlpD